MTALHAPFPRPTNEPVLSYAVGTPERARLKAELSRQSGLVVDIPHTVGGRLVSDGEPFEVRAPHRHELLLGRAHHGGAEVASRAIEAALRVAGDWASLPFEQRARIFLRAADLLSGPFRPILTAATMLGQSKTAFQAEIDAACELADFLRWNVHFASRLSEDLVSPPGVRNVMDMRPLEGFVLAVTPFNFTAIGGNLPTAPALLGNVVVWKPAEAQSLSAYYTMQLLEQAGLPAGVINVVYGEGASVGATCLAHPMLAGVHFTGSTSVFQSIIRDVGARIGSYRSYPRIVGETGGKDFVLIHETAEPIAAAVALVRGAFEYQGQKCSAASRAYVPRSLWPVIRSRVLGMIEQISVGDVADFRNFMGAVIHEQAFVRLAARIDAARGDAGVVVHASGYDRSAGWFVLPTLLEVTTARHPLMEDELFGPLLAVFVYDDDRYDDVVALVDGTSPYALTGAIFARDRRILEDTSRRLRNAAGNLYWNDKPTGAVVGQQPFGGGRASGTNDKAGASYNLMRFVSPRVIKETFVPPETFEYPFMDAP